MRNVLNMYCFLSVMTQEDFRRLKRGKLLILSIQKTHPVYVSNKYILGPMNKLFDSVDPDEFLFSSGTKLYSTIKLQFQPMTA